VSCLTVNASLCNLCSLGITQRAMDKVRTREVRCATSLIEVFPDRRFPVMRHSTNNVMIEAMEDRCMLSATVAGVEAVHHHRHHHRQHGHAAPAAVVMTAKVSGKDDPATHDGKDDKRNAAGKGKDDGALHDINDNHGAAAPGADDPANHDADDKRGGKGKDDGATHH
jgi:hypothetical protein